MSLLAAHERLRERIRREELRKAITEGSLDFRGVALMWEETGLLTLSQAGAYSVPWQTALIAATADVAWSSSSSPDVITIETHGLWTVHAHGRYLFGPYVVGGVGNRSDTRGGIRIRLNGAVVAEQTPQAIPDASAPGVAASVQALTPALVLSPGDEISVEASPTVAADTDWQLAGDLFVEVVLWSES